MPREGGENAVADAVARVVLPGKVDHRNITALLQSSQHWILMLMASFQPRKSQERLLL
jgi:predicted metal-dependent hydrolase|tara:strand:- start:214 stop:387 length:174 start_codon:yes stop_codon:yes gene_type:complete